jgi:nicotinamidase-related amidase
MARTLLLLLLAWACWPAIAAATGPAPVPLRLHSRHPQTGASQWQELALDPRRTAVVVIDMWDRHWCQTYTARVAGLVPRMNATIAAARKLGFPIVWAPSDVVEFYRDYPQRKAMAAIPSHPEPMRTPFNPPQVPQGDYCECGPDHPCPKGKVWSRQQAGLEMAADDLIADCNQGRELLNFCAERGIDTLIYLGVASNMCVCYRSMGMISMRGYGLKTLFVSDLVEAIMANGFDPARQVPDPNFTPAKGSAIVQRFLEQHVAPSIASRQLLAAADLRPAGHDRRLQIVFVIGDDEYETARTLPAFARRYLEPEFRCVFLEAAPNREGGLPGVEAIADADLVVLSLRRQFFTVPVMDRLERYLRAGQPLVALRVSVAAFAKGSGIQPANDGRVVWQDFDQEVLGCRYVGYDSAARATGSEIWALPEAAGHPVLRGLAGARFHSTAWIYRVSPLAEGTTVLLAGRWTESQPREPVAWTRTRERGRLFYTCLGHPDDFDLEPFQTLLDNGIRWVLERP